MLIHVSEVIILSFNDRIKNVTCRSLECVLIAWVGLVGLEGSGQLALELQERQSSV